MRSRCSFAILSAWQRWKKTIDVDVKMILGDEMGRDNTHISLENETSEGK